MVTVTQGLHIPKEVVIYESPRMHCRAGSSYSSLHLWCVPIARLPLCHPALPWSVCVPRPTCYEKVLFWLDQWNSSSWYTPWNISMEHNNQGLVQMIFFYKWMIFSFKMLIFRAVIQLIQLIFLVFLGVCFHILGSRPGWQSSRRGHCSCKLFED